MLAAFDIPITWTALLKRTTTATQSHRGLGIAAELAYYFFLAVFPALLFGLALVSFFPSAAGLPERIANSLGSVAPPEVTSITRTALTTLWQSHHGGLLTFGVVGALWSSSSAIVALIDALDRVYDVEDSRPWWRQRLTAILLTVGVTAFIIASAVLVIAGPELARLVAERAGLGGAFEWAWRILQWPIVFTLVASAIGLLYYFAPDVDQDFVWLTPGSVLATVLWLVVSLAFRVYVVNFGSYNQTYGAIGTVMVLLVWLYLSALAVIVGGEINAEIEHASSHSRASGAPVPGRRKVIGGRAAREFRRRQEGFEGVVRQRPSVAGGNGRRVMAEQEKGIVDVIREALSDAQDLIRTEIALARAELRQAVSRLKVGAAAFAGALVAAVAGVVMLLITIALAIAEGLGWPLWTGFGIVTVLTFAAAIALVYVGKRRFAAQAPMPLTVDTMKENAKWMRARTS